MIVPKLLELMLEVFLLEENLTIFQEMIAQGQDNIVLIMLSWKIK